MKIIIAPILLQRSASVKFPIVLERGVLIRDFPIKEREKLFGITNLKVDGSRINWQPGKSKSPIHWMFGLDSTRLFGAESCIEIKGKRTEPTPALQEKLHVVNQTLKILKSGSAGFLYGFFLGKKAPGWLPGTVMGSGANPLYGDDYVLKKNEDRELKAIYRILSKRSSDEKTTLLVEKFVVSVSKDLRKHMRALEFFSILESLYLPGTEHGELSFRLCQRIAKSLFSRNKVYEGYKQIRQLYDKRSVLVHQAKDRFTKEELRTLEDIVRTSLKLFLKKPSLFERDYLDRLSLR